LPAVGISPERATLQRKRMFGKLLKTIANGRS
jgi:hypothetical protein